MAALSENPLDDPNPSAAIALRLVLGAWETLLSAAGPHFKWTPALVPSRPSRVKPQKDKPIGEDQGNQQKKKTKKNGRGREMTLTGKREIKRAQSEKPLAVLPKAAPRV